MSPLVSVIMPVYNGETYLSEAIESVLRQTYTNFELIIINDGSTDNSKAVVNCYLSDQRIRYFEQSNAGVSAARNIALEKSHGELIAFLDQDDFWRHSKLKTQVGYLENHKNISLIYSDFIFLDENTSKKVSERVSHSLSECDFKSLFITNRIGVLTVVTYKSVIISAGGFNQNLAGTDDYELWLKISLNHEMVYLNEALATYRWHNDNTSRNAIKMTINEINCIEGLLKFQPSAMEYLDKDTINNRLYPLHKKAGDLCSHLNNDNKSARLHYISSLKYSSIKKDILYNILLTFIPPKVKSYAVWRFNKTSNFFNRNK